MSSKHQRKKNGIASCPPAPRNDGLSLFRKPLDVIASEAKQSSATHAAWIASSQELLAMTDLAFGEPTLHVIASASEAIQASHAAWTASSQGLLAMTDLAAP